MVAKRKAVTVTVVSGHASDVTLPLDTILCGDALDVLRTLPDASVDAIVTDPPYGLGAAPDMLEVLRAWLAGEAYIPRGKSGGFMGKAWDAFVPGPEYWRECLRVLKPGGHALVFAGTRTWDVMGLALRLAGFEVRDTLQWLYGSGFPKSLDVGKALDKAAGAQREVIGKRPDHVISRKWREREGRSDLPTSILDITAPATDAARQWDGYGTALKPAWEPIIVCRKPLGEATVAANVLRYGTGALNIGQSRVQSGPSQGGDASGRKGTREVVGAYGYDRHLIDRSMSQGRWPANLLLSHAPDCDETRGCSLWCPVRELDAQSGVRTTGSGRKNTGHSGYNGGWHLQEADHWQGDTGGASRYFATFRYQAKASRAERNRGCEGLPVSLDRNYAGGALNNPEHACSDGAQRTGDRQPRANTHPCVKPQNLMSWLITLITPTGGVVLDPFAGSGSTLCAAKAGGWRYVGIEREAEYVAIAQARLAATQRRKDSTPQ